jgi:hypothetical protein
MSNAVEPATDFAGKMAMAMFLVMFVIGSIPYNFLASRTYEKQYQAMMVEALERRHIMQCPGVRDLRWDCNVPITYDDRSKKEKKDDTDVQNSQ